MSASAASGFVARVWAPDAARVRLVVEPPSAADYDPIPLFASRTATG